MALSKIVLYLARNKNKRKKRKSLPSAPDAKALAVLCMLVSFNLRAAVASPMGPVGGAAAGGLAGGAGYASAHSILNSETAKQISNSTSAKSVMNVLGNSTQTILDSVSGFFETMVVPAIGLADLNLAVIQVINNFYLFF